jgi:hypothetical protein
MEYHKARVDLWKAQWEAMTPRERIVAALSCDYPSEDAEELVNDFAHELANFIRRQGSQHGHARVDHEHVIQINAWAADLIDPYKRRPDHDL